MPQSSGRQAEIVRHAPSAEYPIKFEPAENRVRVQFNGVVVADSNQAMIMREARLAPVYYFPRADVRMDLMHRTRHTTYCPFRGNASYSTLTVGERIAENAVWSYEAPFEDAEEIKGYVAFYQDRMDGVTEAGKEIERTVEPAHSHANPLVNWLLTEAWEAPSASDLVERLAIAMQQSGIPVWRLHVGVRTLHPQVLSRTYRWQAGEGVTENEITHAVLTEQAFLDSPIKLILDGAGGVRRRLDIPNPQLDYPIVRELHGEGATDYVAMPFVFSDGQINTMSLTSRQAGGFSTDALGNIYEILSALSRVFEVHALRYTAVNLLNTYLGQQSGKKVLNGHVQRGDGENIHAVIWFCDLRGSTPLADAMPREAFLELLNEYFDCMAGSVLDHGGEVLRFIGDAALAIFPLTDAERDESPKACETALAAAKDAGYRMEALNHDREARGTQPLGYGIGLHVGDVMYGNIGSEQRLEFTVIGAAANEAARIEGLCKTLGRPLLISAEFARRYPGELESLGVHQLRGVNAKQEIFTLTE